jgi:hypothetical protein
MHQAPNLTIQLQTSELFKFNTKDRLVILIKLIAMIWTILQRLGKVLLACRNCDRLSILTGLKTLKNH